MLEIAIMIEGQNGLNWPRWQAIVRRVEALGFVGLYRSDHFTNGSPPDKESLELWVSLTWLAVNSSRLEFGPLVTPFSFRHPSLTARMAAAVDDLSGGRLTLGLGAGWQEREHDLFGFELLDKRERFARFEEGVECVTRLLRSDGPVTFEGRFYRLHEAQVLPKPTRPGGPRILIGGNGLKRTLPFAARYADEWNANFITAEQFRQANGHLDGLLQAAGRSPAHVRRSLMTGCLFAEDAKGLERKVEARGRPASALRERGMIVATPKEVRSQLDELAEAGVQRVMLQWLDLDDLDGLEALAAATLQSTGRDRTGTRS
jgi:F420-dependent oxidoreductase-like protein